MQVNRISVRAKYIINERDAAEIFLIATKHLKDEVFCRVAELSRPSVEDIFAADLYCHTICIRRYLHRYEQDVAKQSSTKTVNAGCKFTAKIKHVLFLKAFDHNDSLLKNGYGLTASDIAIR